MRTPKKYYSFIVLIYVAYIFKYVYSLEHKLRIHCVDTSCMNGVV